jgi:hypothetical protein
LKNSKSPKNPNTGGMLKQITKSRSKQDKKAPPKAIKRVNKRNMMKEKKDTMTVILSQ